MRLTSYLNGRWQDGTGEGAALRDPVTGETLAHASADGLDLAAGLSWARSRGGPALRAMTYGQRAALLRAIADVLTANREAYGAIALRNSGNTAVDAAMDIDGGIGTLKYYASLGKRLGDARLLMEAGSDQLAKDEAFRAAHIWTPVQGVAVCINAFNFPSWGLWEKAAVALLSGVPVVAKPATATAWLTHQMVEDVIAAGVLPDGALSLVCGGGRGLMDALGRWDLVSFTGSFDTARSLRAHPAVQDNNLRFAMEADSLNLCCFGPDAGPDSAEFALAVKEVTRELTIKAGQKCTAIRRILVPRAFHADAVEALKASLEKVAVGDPRVEGVRMGPLVSKAQQAAAWEGIATLSAEARVVTGGADRSYAPGGVDPDHACFVPPTLLACDSPLDGKAVHAVEVFGPAATIMPYDDPAQAADLAALGGGSLAASVFTGDDAFALSFVPAIAPSHGRLLVVNEAIGKSHTGHGNAMPQTVHGGPGRAGGGEELGGLRALRFYHQRSAVQSSADRLEALRAQAVEVAL
ncbi:3,4-dehydroadipyl-CoA semialdehyde dehydrogenase [Novispirillum sp. DQ9]|uniref:3,4-dehydroadipyl-CoA semialdehyde dehydrogenase n=1 Tax=Novispirillum sp. DQ9 TaxID=3398612 RepID=UPI003C7B70E7